MREGAAQVLAEALADLLGEGAWSLQASGRTLRHLGCQSEGLELRRLARGVLAHQHEVAGVGHQHQPVALLVAT